MTAGTPSRSRSRTVLGFIIALVLFLASAWIAFGPGPRQCSVTVSLGFLVRHGLGGDRFCRGAFAVSTTRPASRADR